MGLSYFKPKKDGGGMSANITIDSKGGKIYVHFTRQVGTEKKFSGGEKGLVSFNVNEIGSMIWAIEERKEFSTVHVFEKNGTSTTTSISFGPFVKDGQLLGFSLRTTRVLEGQKQQFTIGFKPDEAITLREYLKYALTHCFNAIYSEDVKYGKEAAEKKKAAANKVNNTQSEPNKAAEDPFADDAGPTETKEEEVF